MWRINSKSGRKGTGDQVYLMCKLQPAAQKVRHRCTSYIYRNSGTLDRAVQSRKEKPRCRRPRKASFKWVGMPQGKRIIGQPGHFTYIIADLRLPSVDARLK